MLDEVHYLQDPYRGSVWEEVLVLTPPEVRFVCLSATVNNAADFGAWLRSVRGTDPGHRGDPPPGHPAPPLRRGRAGQRRAHRASRCCGTGGPTPTASPSTSAGAATPATGYRAPRRAEMVEDLAAAGHAARHRLHLLAGPPATTPSASACSDGVRLTTPEERARIRQLTEAAVERLGDDDLRILGYGPWSAALEAGWRPTTPGWSRPSARRWRSASPPGC